MSTMFLDYINRNYILEHFLDEQEGLHEKGWYKFKKFEPEKWLNEFLDVVVKWRMEHEREEMKGQQLDLF